MSFTRAQYPNLPESNLKHLETLAAVLEQYTREEAEDLLTLHSDPKQVGGLIMPTMGIQGKIILTEGQFNLVKKVYPDCFTGGHFSLKDNHLVLQFFMNLKGLYS